MAGDRFSVLQLHENPPLSLYIHLPWCVKKCPYCDFNSHALAAEKLPEREYVAALIRDLEFELPRIWGRRLTSIFIGGGTPSIFSGAAIKALLSTLHAYLNFGPDIEITLEANPGTIDSDHFREYKKAGVNRLSIGVQSFSDMHLAALNRVHGAKEARCSIEIAQAVGFDNINIDIMFGLPDQTLEQVIRDLQAAIDFKPDHISWYELTIEPNTMFYSRPPSLPDEEYIWRMQQAGQSLLKQEGFYQYEVSAYARKQRKCQHNLNYWQFGDYLGIGSGAHGKITDVSQNDIKRFVRHRLPMAYIRQAGSSKVIIKEKVLSTVEIPFEFMLNALRLIDGFTPRLFFDRTGLPLKIIKAELDQARQQGMIREGSDNIVPTSKGRQYLNDLITLFLPEIRDYP